MLTKHKTNKNDLNYNYTKKTILFTNARDELHIKEWAAHHLLIGFDLIIIFDNKSVIPLSSVFSNFDKRVIVINANNISGAIKMPLMNYASKIAKYYKADWMIYLDADEYIILNNKFVGIKHFLNYYNNAHSIGINWLMFGTNNLLNNPEGGLLENYTKSEIKLDKHVKSFVRPNEILFANNPHFYHIKNTNKMFGINGKNIESPYTFNDLNMPFYYAPIYIAHYIYQSEETFINRKVNKPRDDIGTYRPIDKDEIKKIHNEYNNVFNLQPKNKYSEKVKSFLDHF
jgi:hypothetical protein